MLTDVIGILAGLFVILAFYAQQGRYLRAYAILSNILFLAYAVLESLLPVLLLHAILLPLNLARLHQIETRLRQAGTARPPRG